MGRIRRYSDVIGQTFNKSVVLAKLKSGDFPKFSIFEGASGSGKSTLAELVGLSRGCERSDTQPCLECESCRSSIKGLESTGKSLNIIKINCGELVKAQDINATIDNVFKEQVVVGRNVTFIFEEFHALKDASKQIPFLEWLERIQDGVCIIICTTNIHLIIEEIRSRAKLKLQFKKLTKDECKILINKKCEQVGIAMKEMDKEFLINCTKHSAREISNFIDTFKDVPDFSTCVKKNFSIIDTVHYVAYIEMCFYDFPTFVLYLDTLSLQVDSMVDFWNGMREFIKNSIYYLYGRGGTLFTTHEKSRISSVLGKLSEDELQKMLALSNHKVKDNDDAEYYLITFRSIFHKTITKADAKVQAEVENTKASQSAIVEENKEVKPSVTKITDDLLLDISGDNTVYDIE